MPDLKTPPPFHPSDGINKRITPGFPTIWNWFPRNTQNLRKFDQIAPKNWLIPDRHQFSFISGSPCSSPQLNINYRSPKVNHHPINKFMMSFLHLSNQFIEMLSFPPVLPPVHLLHAKDDHHYLISPTHHHNSSAPRRRTAPNVSCWTFAASPLPPPLYSAPALLCSPQRSPPRSLLSSQSALVRSPGLQRRRPGAMACFRICLCSRTEIEEEKQRVRRIQANKDCWNVQITVISILMGSRSCLAGLEIVPTSNPLVSCPIIKRLVDGESNRVPKRLNPHNSWFLYTFLLLPRLTDWPPMDVGQERWRLLQAG